MKLHAPHLKWMFHTCTRYAILNHDVPSWCKGFQHMSLICYDIPWCAAYAMMYTMMLKIVQECTKVEDAQGRGMRYYHDG